MLFSYVYSAFMPIHFVRKKMLYFLDDKKYFLTGNHFPITQL
jgi:hypothetical protein